MTAEPRVVLLLDPRPGERPADRLELPGGRTLAQEVGDRAVAEGGELSGVVTGAAGISALISGLSSAPTTAPTTALPAEQAAAVEPEERALCLVDAAALALPTTYGDVVADPRDDSCVLQSDGGRAVAVRLHPAALRDRATTDLLLRALRSAPTGSSLTVLAATAAAGGYRVRQLGPGDLPLVMVGGPRSLAAALTAEQEVDEAAVRLLRSSRADDGFLSTFLVRPLSRQLTRRAVALGIRPAVVTGASCLLGLLAAGSYAGGGLGWRLAGSLLLLLSLVIDCVDGEVARYTRTFSPLGGWLDVGSDRLKEYAVYAGLAYGAHPSAWGLAAAAFAVLVFRHFVDFGYAATVSDDVLQPPGAGAPVDPVATWSGRTSSRPWLVWVKRSVILPVGERTIALAVLAPLVGARWALGLLLAGGCLSAAYTFAGRFGRLVLRRGPARPRSAVVGERLRAQVDLGLLPVVAPSGRLGWLTPAAARALEQGGLALLVGWHRPGALPAAYLLLAAVALHQYDVVYRQRLAEAGGDEGWLGRVGWPVRVLVVGVLVLALPPAGLRAALLVLGVLAALLTALDSVTWWRSFVRSGGQAPSARHAAYGSDGRPA